MADHKQEAERLLEEGQAYVPARESVERALVHATLALVEALKER